MFQQRCGRIIITCTQVTQLPVMQELGRWLDMFYCTLRDKAQYSSRKIGDEILYTYIPISAMPFPEQLAYLIRSTACAAGLMQHAKHVYIASASKWHC